MDTDYHTVEVTGQLRYKTGAVVSKPIQIGRNAWVGYHSIVLKGVSVGENSVVGAGPVVMHSVPDNAVVFGNPARVIWPLRGGARSADGDDRQESAAAYASEGS